ncbi:CoA-binding protein [Niabella beijingensis]|uniref:CoA-binding protein n=1 Tax=Niabella beijingensis TaxID=2872700 RepID=UPI001CC0307F|nr:CoA-binding protein [Niabella beijingensis]MBZ4187885.1 CoA-binding protein [Niabella beijingensis]
MNKKTVVLGASENPARYSNMAIRRLRTHGHEVVAIGKQAGQIGDVVIQKEQPDAEGVDTVTVYLNPLHQQQYEEYILKLHPKRVIFNPGAENDALSAKIKAAGIEPVEACTLVLLTTSQY